MMTTQAQNYIHCPLQTIFSMHLPISDQNDFSYIQIHKKEKLARKHLNYVATQSLDNHMPTQTLKRGKF